MKQYKNRKEQGQIQQQLCHRYNFTKLDSNNKFVSNKIIDDKKFQYNCHSSTGFYEDNHKYNTDCHVCEHQAKIEKLKQKLKRLEFQQLELQKENDHIMRSIESSSLRTKNAEKNAEVWKNKYEKLKAENDRKAVKLAYAPLSICPLSNQFSNKNESKALSTKRRQNSTKELKNPQKYQLNHVKSRQQIFALTKQQKQYVRHLQSQQQKRRRTNSNVASMKNLHPYDPSNDGPRQRDVQLGQRTQRKYSARLDDGLVIHIIDERGKEKQRQRARSYRK